MNTLTETPPPPYTFCVGDRVMVSGGRFHGPARIVKVNRVNIDVAMESNNQKVRCAPVFLKPLAMTADAPAYTPPVIDYVPELALGTVVTCNINTVRRQPKLAGLFVVLASSGADRTRIAKLGGLDGPLYWRVPTRDLEKVPLEVLASYLP
jgi:hypothetical protein